jgi:hypothetical protein
VAEVAEVCQPHRRLAERAQRPAEVERRAGRVAPLGAIEIVPATLGPDAGAVGAALAAAEPAYDV